MSIFDVEMQTGGLTLKALVMVNPFLDQYNFYLSYFARDLV